MAKDEWVRAAMADDAVVVELLVGLKQSQATAASASSSSSPSPKSWPRTVVPPRWGLRQPKSRPRCDAVSRKKEADFTRCSPTTPLSWSGGASPSPMTDDRIENLVTLFGGQSWNYNLRVGQFG